MRLLATSESPKYRRISCSPAWSNFRLRKLEEVREHWLVHEAIMPDDHPLRAIPWEIVKDCPCGQRWHCSVCHWGVGGSGKCSCQNEAETDAQMLLFQVAEMINSWSE